MEIHQHPHPSHGLKMERIFLGVSHVIPCLFLWFFSRVSTWACYRTTKRKGVHLLHGERFRYGYSKFQFGYKPFFYKPATSYENTTGIWLIQKRTLWYIDRSVCTISTCRVCWFYLPRLNFATTKIFRWLKTYRR